MEACARPAPAPARKDFTSDAATSTQWGWRVMMRRDVRELARLQDAGRRGFKLGASNTTQQLTPGASTAVRSTVVTLRVKRRAAAG